MLEVELKAALAGIDPEALRRRAAAAGFVPRRHLRETDTYFAGIDRDFGQTDEALRLRRRKDLDGGGEQALATYKGPRNDPRSSARLEVETAVADGEAMAALLAGLGFRPAYTVVKTRRELERADVTLCLDTVEGLGDYLELETLVAEPAGRDAAVDRLLQLLDALAVPRENLTRTSYLEMLLAGQ